MIIGQLVCIREERRLSTGAEGVVALPDRRNLASCAP